MEFEFKLLQREMAVDLYDIVEEANPTGEKEDLLRTINSHRDLIRNNVHEKIGCNN